MLDSTKIIENGGQYLPGSTLRLARLLGITRQLRRDLWQEYMSIFASACEVRDLLFLLVRLGLYIYIVNEYGLKETL